MGKRLPGGITTVLFGTGDLTFSSLLPVKEESGWGTEIIFVLLRIKTALFDKRIG